MTETLDLIGIKTPLKLINPVKSKLNENFIKTSFPQLFFWNNPKYKTIKEIQSIEELPNLQIEKIFFRTIQQNRSNKILNEPQ